MTKTIRRMLSLVMALAICLSFALSVSASSDSRTAGIYGFIHGYCAQDELEPHILNTTTRVTRNPDGAYLKTQAEYYEKETPLPSDAAISQAGDKILTQDLTIFVTIEGIPDTAYVNHHVCDVNDEGVEEIKYSAFTYTSVEFESMEEWEQ